MNKNEYFNGENYNWGIVTIYTIRGYLGLLSNYLHIIIRHMPIS